MSTQPPQEMLARAAAGIRKADADSAEMEELLSRLARRTWSKVPPTGLSSLLRDMTKERQALQKISVDLAESVDHDEELLRKLGNRLGASVTFINHASSHWSILRRCRSLAAVNQSFDSTTKESRRRHILARASEASGKEKQLLQRELKEQGRVEVHVVDGGSEWVDIRSVNLDRLARQMTDAGWGWGEHERGDVVDEEEWESVLLAKQVRRVVQAARLNRWEYRIPRVRLVLPKLRIGENEDVDVFLEQFTRLDPWVELMIDDANSAFLTNAPLPTDEALDNLQGDDELARLTPTINMDHTILIDLISDITHAKLEAQPWQATTTQAQIRDENSTEDGIMAKTLYPILRGRRLVCTKEAAEHFHEVLSTVGTATERQRGHLLVPDPSSQSSENHARFCALSIHPPPPDVQIPITIRSDPTDFEAAVDDGRLPRVALDVARCGGFKSSKLSIYMHGWMEDIVTVTSNKEISGHIKTLVEANRRPGEETVVGPRIHKLDVTRNLLAKSATPRDVD
jgi:hypothetical protein